MQLDVRRRGWSMEDERKSCVKHIEECSTATRHAEVLYQPLLLTPLERKLLTARHGVAVASGGRFGVARERGGVVIKFDADGVRIE